MSWEQERHILFALSECLSEVANPHMIMHCRLEVRQPHGVYAVHREQVFRLDGQLYHVQDVTGNQAMCIMLDRVAAGSNELCYHHQRRVTIDDSFCTKADFSVTVLWDHSYRKPFGLKLEDTYIAKYHQHPNGNFSR